MELYEVCLKRTRPLVETDISGLTELEAKVITQFIVSFTTEDTSEKLFLKWC